MLDLETRHLLVIGGRGTIGAAVVESARAGGARVTATTSSEPPESSADGLSWATLDVTEHGALEQLLETTPGITDIIVAAAARPFGSLAEMPASDVVALVDTKLWGSFHVGRAAERLPKNGTLTFISGLLAQYPDAASPVAAVSAAVESLGRGLAVELAPVRVNVISPAALGSKGRGEHEGTPADVAEAILFAVRHEWMSGSVLELHGAGRP